MARSAHAFEEGGWGASEALHGTAAGLLVPTLGVLALAVLPPPRAQRLSGALALAGAAIVNLRREHRARLRWLDARAPLDRATYREAA